MHKQDNWDIYQRAIGQFITEAVVWVTLKWTVILWAIWAFLLGIMVVVLRSGLGLARTELLWPLWGFAVLLAVAIIIAWRKKPTPKAVRALIDNKCHIGGIFVASQERKIGCWREMLPGMGNIKLSWAGKKHSLALLLAVIFLATGYILPQRYIQLSGPGKLDINDELQDLSAKIDKLEEEKIIEPEQAQLMLEHLDEIKKNARADDPAKTWGNLNEMGERIDQQANDAMAEMLKELAQQQKAQGFSRALAGAMDKMSPDNQKLAMEKLAELMEKALEKTDKSLLNQELAQNLEEMLGQELIDALAQGQMLDAGQLEAIAAGLGGNCQAGRALMMKLNNMGLLQPGMMARGNAMGQFDFEGLEAMLAEAGLDGEGFEGLSLDGMLAISMPGQYGISKGPGPAELTFTNPSNQENTAFKEQALPPGQFSDAKDSSVVAISVGDPTSEGYIPAGQGALQGANAGGGSTTVQTVLPKHKSAVNRYFQH